MTNEVKGKTGLVLTLRGKIINPDGSEAGGTVEYKIPLVEEEEPKNDDSSPSKAE